MSASRLVRMMGILFDVASGEVQSLDELAALRGVSRRTLQRDLRALRLNSIEVLFREDRAVLPADARAELRRLMGADG